ncbi:hypothetical protein CsSME_00001922 [Camellia sinensis var. sinensis]
MFLLVVVIIAMYCVLRLMIIKREDQPASLQDILMLTSRTLPINLRKK